MGRSIMISNATNPLKEYRKESLLRCAGSKSICVWLICDLVVMCVQVVGDCALGDLCVNIGGLDEIIFRILPLGSLRVWYSGSYIGNSSTTVPLSTLSPPS